MTDENDNKNDQTGEETPQKETRNLRDELQGGNLGLDDLPQYLKDAIEKNQRRAVTEARQKWDDQNRQPDQDSRRQDDGSSSKDRSPEEKPLTRSELQEILRQDRLDQERDRRAQELVDSTFREAGLDPNGPDFQKLNDFFYDGIDKGMFDKNVIRTAAGIKSLMLMAGIGQQEVHNPNYDPYDGDGAEKLNTGKEKYMTEGAKQLANPAVDKDANDFVRKQLRDQGLFM